MSDKKSFVLYCDIGQHLALLSDEEAGQLFKALVRYADTGEQSELPPMAGMAFSFISAQIERDSQKWKDIREKRKQAGRIGGSKRQANQASALSAKQTRAKQAVNVTVPVNANVPVPVTVKNVKSLHTRFAAPGEAEVIAYFETQQCTAAEASAFFDYYTANGWKVGKNPMKDWQATARNWIRRTGKGSYPAMIYAQGDNPGDVLSRAAEKLTNGDFSDIKESFYDD